MTQSSCPHCGNDPGLSVWQKLSLGGRWTRPCRSCGRALTVGVFVSMLFLALTGLLPLCFLLFGLAVGDGAGDVVQLSLAVAGVLLGLIVQGGLYYRFVPLVARSN